MNRYALVNNEGVCVLLVMAASAPPGGIFPGTSWVLVSTRSVQPGWLWSGSSWSAP